MIHNREYIDKMIAGSISPDLKYLSDNYYTYLTTESDHELKNYAIDWLFNIISLIAAKKAGFKETIYINIVRGDGYLPEIDRICQQLDHEGIDAIYDGQGVQIKRNFKNNNNQYRINDLDSHYRTIQWKQNIKIPDLYEFTHIKGHTIIEEIYQWGPQTQEKFENYISNKPWLIDQYNNNRYYKGITTPPITKLLHREEIQLY